mmetsp:Transcript_111443/g.359715  ORF Transcript_111443/g.359715 Transcript_111443/m.359715 type:complete len:355 (-) Transcript_111443:124-1188(-)
MESSDSAPVASAAAAVSSFCSLGAWAWGTVPADSRGGMESSDSALPASAKGARSRFSDLMETFSPEPSSRTGTRLCGEPARASTTPLRPFSSAFERPRSTTASPSLKPGSCGAGGFAGSALGAGWALPTYSSGGISSSLSAAAAATGFAGGGAWEDVVAPVPTYSNGGISSSSSAAAAAWEGAAAVQPTYSSGGMSSSSSAAACAGSVDAAAGAVPTYSSGGMSSLPSSAWASAGGAFSGAARSRFSALMATFLPDASSFTGSLPSEVFRRHMTVPFWPFRSAFDRPLSTTLSPSLKLTAAGALVPTYSNGGKSSSSSAGGLVLGACACWVTPTHSRGGISSSSSSALAAGWLC